MYVETGTTRRAVGAGVSIGVGFGAGWGLVMATLMEGGPAPGLVIGDEARLTIPLVSGVAVVKAVQDTETRQAWIRR